MTELTWWCHLCARERPDEFISVYKIDKSEKYGLPPGTITLNVRFCNDNEKCRDAAPRFSFFNDTPIGSTRCDVCGQNAVMDLTEKSLCSSCYSDELHRVTKEILEESLQEAHDDGE